MYPNGTPHTTQASFVSAVKAQAAGKAARLKKLETEADNAAAKLAW